MAKARKMKMPAANPVANAALDAHVPNIEVLERRLAAPDNPNVPAIRLKNQPEPMTLRIVNTDLANRFVEATQRHGWLPVKADELVDPPALIGFEVNASGFVVRGPRGLEVLCKMPTRYYAKILRTQEQRHLSDLASEKKQRERRMAAAEARAGERGENADEAATSAGHLHGRVVTTFGRDLDADEDRATETA